jgi:hypothetical protein
MTGGAEKEAAMMSYNGQQVETYDGTPMTDCLG